MQVEAKCHPLPVRPSRVGWLLRRHPRLRRRTCFTHNSWLAICPCRREYLKQPGTCEYQGRDLEYSVRTPASKIETQYVAA